MTSNNKKYRYSVYKTKRALNKLALFIILFAIRYSISASFNTLFEVVTPIQMTFLLADISPAWSISDYT